MEAGFGGNRGSLGSGNDAEYDNKVDLFASDMQLNSDRSDLTPVMTNLQVNTKSFGRSK